MKCKNICESEHDMGNTCCCCCEHVAECKEIGIACAFLEKYNVETCVECKYKEEK